MSCSSRLVALLIAFLPVPAAWALGARTEVSATRIENIHRASSPVDWRDATRYEARGAFGGFREWTTGLLTAAELEGAFEHVPHFTRLNAASAGLAATARQKFGLGAFSPSIAADVAIHRRDTRLDLDDGWTTSAGLRLTKRFLHAWRAGLHGDWQEHYARSAIYDTTQHRFFATLTWDITERLQLSHGNGRLWGNFTANASPAVWSRALGGALGSHISNYYNAVPWAATDAAGSGWITYRVDGRVSFYWIELSPALGRNTSLPLRFENRVSVNKVGVKYRQDLWSLALLHRF